MDSKQSDSIRTDNIRERNLRLHALEESRTWRSSHFKTEQNQRRERREVKQRKTSPPLWFENAIRATRASSL